MRISYAPSIASMKTFSQATSLVIMLVGGLVLAGWTFEIPALKSILPELPSMKANTALGFVVMGLAFWLLPKPNTSRSQQIVALVCAGLITMLGLLTLFEYAFDLQLGIDEWLFKDHTKGGNNLIPGRMSPIVALNFFFVGIALFFLGRRTNLGDKIAHILILFVVLFSGLALLGYAYGATFLYGFGAFNQIAVHSSVTFIIATVGLLCSYPDRGLMKVITSQNAGGFMARSLLPSAIMLPVILGWLYFQGHRAGFYDDGLEHALMIASGVIVIVIIIWWNAYLLDQTDVELKTAQAADLRKNEERLQYVIWAIRDAIWDRNMVSGEIWWNEGLRKLFRYTDSQIEPTVMWWREHIHPEDQERVVRSIQTVIDTSQKFWSEEYRFQRADGSYANIFDRSYIIYNDITGRPERMIGAMADITEQKQAEQALRQSEELFAKAFSASPAGITLTRKSDGRVLEVNAAYLNMVGYSRAEVMNHTTLEMELISPEDRARLLKIFEEQGRVRDFEHWVKMKSGVLRAVLSSLEQVQIGETTCFLAIIYDITERKQIEAALHESEERYRLMIDNVKDYAIFLLDPQGNVKTWNAGAEYIKGYSADQIIGRSFSTFYPQEDIESGKPEKILRQAAIEARAEDEGWRVRKDGSRFWAHVIITALYNASGDLRGFSKVARNITERKQAEIAQQQSEALFRALFELSPDSVVIIDPHDPNNSWPIIDCNAAACFMNGYRRDELIGRSIDILNGTSASPSERQAYMEQLREKGILKAEFQHRSKDGLFFPIETSTTLIKIGERELIIGIDRNIAERKQAEELLNNTNDKLKNGLAELDQRNHEMMLLTELSNLLQACQTSDEAYMIISETVSKIFPETGGGLYIINGDKDLVEAVAVWGTLLPEEHVFAPNDCLALRRRRPHFVAEDHPSLQCKHILNEPVASSICVPMTSQEGVFGIFHLRHIGQQRKGLKLFDQGLVETVADTVALALTNLMLRETLRNQSIRDPLTGLFNRRFMDESLEREVHRAARSKRSLGIIMLDLDHFKKFNDTFGHEAGDTVLRELGDFLKSHIRKGDIPCRYGGEEFMLLLPEASLEITRQRAQQLCEEVRNLRVQHRNQMLGKLTLSLGVAVFPTHGELPDDVVRAADAALYRAKKEGRDRVAVAEQTPP